MSYEREGNFYILKLICKIINHYLFSDNSLKIPSLSTRDERKRVRQQDMIYPKELLWILSIKRSTRNSEVKQCTIL